MTPDVRRLLDGSRGAAAILALVLIALVPDPAYSQTLNGSPAALDRQNAQARAHDFSYLRTPQEVRNFVEMGYLVPVIGNEDFDLHQVSFPYARPELAVFIERLASQYRAACGEKLVVTSLTRPLSNQPPNASNRSVHPTGMAVDLRRSNNTRCRQWLESTLLSLDAADVLDATYERNPPHYHVAVFPQPYAQYLAERTGNAALLIQAARERSQGSVRTITHTVTRGETLSGLSTRYNVAMSRIRADNGLRGDGLVVGQQLRITVYEATPAPTQVVAQSTTSAPAAVAATTSAPGGASSPAPSSSPAPPPPSDNGGIVHTVTRGESLWTIARLYGLTEGELRVANGLNGSRILAGQTLQIPAAGARSGDSIRYTVQRGDSLWIIATRVGTTVDEIRRQNGMGSTRIYEGQVLDIPVAR
jgi:LysM repeat protein